MRTGLGTSKGELLSVQAQHAELMDWEGTQFPVGEALVETVVPEAFHCVNGVLSHLHQDLDERFPKAVADAALEDLDPPDEYFLEERGTRVGKDGVRFQ